MMIVKAVRKRLLIYIPGIPELLQRNPLVQKMD